MFGVCAEVVEHVERLRGMKRPDAKGIETRALFDPLHAGAGEHPPEDVRGFSFD